MPASVASFLCVLTPKSLELGQDHKLHKHVQAQELDAELQALIKPWSGQPSGTTQQSKEGGGLVAFGEASEVSTADIGDRICVFQGTLKNLQALILKHGSPHDAEEDAVSPAEMVLHLYDSLGLSMLAQLSGKFSLCMYDAKQMRVLAARDGSGTVPLLQARTSRDSLVISSNPALLTCCHDTLEFAPGFFKYGWHAEPRLFTPADTNPAHHGPARRSIDHQHAASNSRASSRRASLDKHHHHSNPASAPRHTPQGGLRRTSTDNGHHLTFSSPSRSHDSKARTSHDSGHHSAPRISTKNSKGADGTPTPANPPTTHGFKLNNKPTSSPQPQAKQDSPASVKSPVTPALPASRGSPACAGTPAAATSELAHPMGNLNINAKAFVPSPAAATS